MAYIIKAEMTEDHNPDFAPADWLQEGKKADGFILMTFDEDGDPTGSAFVHVTVINAAKGLATSSAFLQSAILADAFNRAKEVADREEREEHSRAIKDLLGVMLSGRGED